MTRPSCSHTADAHIPTPPPGDWRAGLIAAAGADRFARPCPRCDSPTAVETIEAPDMPRHERRTCAECGWWERVEEPDREEFENGN